uniref:Uncharacterized protein n=1 Tax=Hyaloperonospora arabidopsidis (strain Emoy2) TaxID=559515 RepID=M4BJ60_HYAAE
MNLRSAEMAHSGAVNKVTTFGLVCDLCRYKSSDGLSRLVRGYHAADCGFESKREFRPSRSYVPHSTQDTTILDKT